MFYSMNQVQFKLLCFAASIGKSYFAKLIASSLGAKCDVWYIFLKNECSDFINSSEICQMCFHTYPEHHPAPYTPTQTIP